MSLPGQNKHKHASSQMAAALQMQQLDSRHSWTFSGGQAWVRVVYRTSQGTAQKKQKIQPLHKTRFCLVLLLFEWQMRHQNSPSLTTGKSKNVARLLHSRVKCTCPVMTTIDPGRCPTHLASFS